MNLDDVGWVGLKKEKKKDTESSGWDSQVTASLLNLGEGPRLAPNS